MNYETFNIFPTTIYAGELEQHQEHKNSFYNIYPKYDYTDDDRNNTVSENVGNPLLHLEDELEGLFADIISHTKSYTRDVLGYKDIFDYVITKSWLSRHRDSRTIPWHIHASCHISFVYYVSIPPNSHTITFQNVDSKNKLWIGNKEGRYDDLKMIETPNHLNAEKFFIHPPEGYVLLFPSMLHHCTEHNDDGFIGERIAIVGDITLVLKEEYLKYSTGYINPKYWKVYQ